MKHFRHILLVAIFLFFIVGKLLDWEAERVVQQLYMRNTKGIILGAKDITYQTPANDQALFLIHGYSSDPSWSRDIINQLKKKINIDVLSPLLPFHGKSLEDNARLDNKKVEDFILSKINTLTKQYKKLTILARSYGGSSLLRILDKIKEAQKIQIVLYAPAIYLKENNLWGNCKLFLTGLWRNYYNYKQLGVAQRPLTQDADSKLRYFVVSAVKEVFKQDTATRKILTELRHPIDILISKADTYIDYMKISKVCQLNPHISMHTFSYGGHSFHKSPAYQQQFIDLLKSIINRQ